MMSPEMLRAWRLGLAPPAPASKLPRSSSTQKSCRKASSIEIAAARDGLRTPASHSPCLRDARAASASTPADVSKNRRMEEWAAQTGRRCDATVTGSRVPGDAPSLVTERPRSSTRLTWLAINESLQSAHQRYAARRRATVSCTKKLRVIDK
jgi:hypothetical protein